MTGECFEVPPTSRVAVRRVAMQVRTAARQEEVEAFPIIDLLELALPRGIDNYVFLVMEMTQMEEEGLTYSSPPTIILREDVYNGACSWNGRDRFTAAHEAGHLFLHSQVPFARKTHSSKIPAYKSSEWQANQFAAELMMPIHVVKRMSSAAELAARPKMSLEAAEIRWNALRKEGCI